MVKLFKKTLNNLLKNKIVLYVLVALALTNILGYISMNNNQAVILFISLSLITSFFSKNMIIILAVPLLLVNLLISVNVGVETMKNRVKKGKNKKSEDEEENVMENDNEMVSEEENVEEEENTTNNVMPNMANIEEMEPMLERAEK
jgi:choline-glycine betaine transporter